MKEQLHHYQQLQQSLARVEYASVLLSIKSRYWGGKGDGVRWVGVSRGEA